MKGLYRYLTGFFKGKFANIWASIGGGGPHLRHGVGGKAGARLKGRIIPVRGISSADERAWRDLPGRAAEPNPFYEADCVIPAATHQVFGAEINLAVAEDDGRFFGCVPIRAVRRWKFPYPVVTTQVRRMGYLGTPLLDPDAGTDAAEAILRAIATTRSSVHSRILLIDTSCADGPVADLMRCAAKRLGFPLRSYESWERGKLERLDSPTYDRVHSSKTRYNLRRQRRLLEKDTGTEVSVVDRTADATALAEYVALEAKGYKASEGVAMTTVPGEPEYFVDMCRRFEAEGRLHVLSLQAGDTALAMEIWVRGGDGLFLMKISYDERYKRYGPGVLLQMEAMKYFHEKTDASWIDTCTSAGNDLLLRLYPARRKVEMLAVILGPSPVDRAVVAGFVAARPIHNRWYDITHRGVKTGSRDADHSRETAAGPGVVGPVGHRKAHLATVSSSASGVSRAATIRLPSEAVEGSCDGASDA
jgi:CelD/BcsL family acetyltransferase involved in cellulose biosynthesis